MGKMALVPLEQSVMAGCLASWVLGVHGWRRAKGGVASQVKEFRNYFKGN